MEKFWAGGFLYNPKNKTILLHQRDFKTKFNPGKWAFFGGLNQKSESPKDCFIRELKEELGINIQTEQIKPVRDYLNKEFNTYRYVFYVESDLAKSAMTLKEGADFSWIDISKIAQYDLTQKTSLDLKFFLKNIIN
ncbi:MAG TPA: NUDIX domain-containing protein [Patescibacteria group bacterium]|nr:NUDIX domain-containing protein [Patescibacteria group bacterium]